MHDNVLILFSSFVSLAVSFSKVKIVSKLGKKITCHTLGESIKHLQAFRHVCVTCDVTSVANCICNLHCTAKINLTWKFSVRRYHMQQILKI